MVKKRYRNSQAYIDSGKVGVFLLAATVFSVWIAILTAGVVSPWWLSVAIISITVYELMIYWLVLQYQEADKIFLIFTVNILFLSLILSTSEYLLNIELPTSLPVLNLTLYFLGYQAESLSPSSVAISYSVLAIWLGLFTVFIYSFIDDLPVVSKIKKLLLLDKLDLKIDILLDKFSFWLGSNNRGWYVTPLLLQVILFIFVSGLAYIA